MGRLPAGTRVQCEVDEVTAYGAWLHIEGQHHRGLCALHNISWGRVTDPADYFRPGQSCELVVLKHEPEDGRAVLSRKHLEPDPWHVAADRLVAGNAFEGTVTSHADYGVFIDILPHLEGLLHLEDILEARPELVHPREFADLGSVVRVQIKSVDVADRRLSFELQPSQDGRTYARGMGPCEIPELPWPGRLVIWRCPELAEQDLAPEDRRRLDDARVDVVVSLLEPEELQQYGETEAARASAVLRGGFRYINVPIEDFAAPSVEAYEVLRTSVTQVLQRGDTVLVHCMAGLGRAGTTAACLLVESGMRPEDAIHLVRWVRPGAIQSEEQEDFIKALGDSQE